MKRTDTITKAISFVLFAAFAIYLLVFAFRTLDGNLVMAEAVTSELSAGGTASGIIIRSEIVLEGYDTYLSTSLSEGEKVAKGGNVAVSMSGEAGLLRERRIKELEADIEYISSARKLAEIRSDFTAHSQQVDIGIRDLRFAVAAHDAGGIVSGASQVKALFFGAGDTDISESHLNELKTELQSLKSSYSADSEPLLAPEAGLFSFNLDGYEHLGPDDLGKLLPSELEELIDDKEEVSENAYGKLVTGNYWYFASVMTVPDAGNLSVGSYVALDFGRYLSENVYAKVISIGPREDGRCCVVFRSDKKLSELLPFRKLSASVVFQEYRGIRVPSEAIRTDDKTETTFVWVNTAMKLERKNVKILYCADGYVIVERGAEASALREGNMVVVRGKNLYEGKIIHE